MSAIKPTTRERIKAYLETFIEKKVVDIRSRTIMGFEDIESYMRQLSKKGYIKPFHAAIIPEEVRKINAFERSFSTTLGTTFEECALLIARDHHKQAERGYDLRGSVSLSALDEIERQVSLFDRSTGKGMVMPKVEQMLTSILRASRPNDLVNRTFRADLFILTNDNNKLFFEIKSPKPNKGQCLEVTQRLLRFYLLTSERYPQTQSYFAMAYNPYGQSRSDYAWSIPKKYMPYNETVLIGHEFWDLVGGSTTMDELLELYWEVGQAKSKYIFDALAFGF